MKKKLTKHGNDFVLVLDKALLKNLGITTKTELTLSVEKGNLVVKPTKKETKTIEQSADKIIKKYHSVLKKLA